MQCTSSDRGKRVPEKKRVIQLVTGQAIHGTLHSCGDEAAPLLVLIHGGAYTRRYFDTHGASLVARATEKSFDVFNLDRPGHGGSPPLKKDSNLFERNAEAISNAIDDLVTQRINKSVVLIGHSIGGAIAIILAASRPEWLQGIAVSGVGCRPDTKMSKVLWPLRHLVRHIYFPLGLKRTTVYGPKNTYDKAIANISLKAASAPALTQELIEIQLKWPSILPSYAQHVLIPVHARLGEYDSLWSATPKDARDFGSFFSSSTRVDSQITSLTGHCIDQSLPGPRFHAEQLNFARSCLLNR